MITANLRGWGDPASSTFEADVRADCVLVKAGGISVRVRKPVADIFRYLNTALARTYNLAGYADDYGLAIRPIRGYESKWAATKNPRYLSNHSYGLAEDLDSSVNPMTSDLKAQHEFIRAVVDPLLAPFQGRLVWGGEYAGARKDYMHFEYVGTLEQAIEDAALARRLLADLTKPKPKPKPLPPTTPALEETTMFIIHSPAHSYALVTANPDPNPKAARVLLKTLTPAQAKVMAKSVRLDELTDAEWMTYPNQLAKPTP